MYDNILWFLIIVPLNLCNNNVSTQITIKGNNVTNKETTIQITLKTTTAMLQKSTATTPLKIVNHSGPVAANKSAVVSKNNNNNTNAKLKSASKNTTTTSYPFTTVTFSEYDNDNGLCFKPTCLAHKCVADPKVMTLAGVTSIGVMKRACNNTYLFSKIELSWIEAQEKCCSLNMTLLNIASYEEQKCVRELNQLSGFHTKIKYHNHYWLGGSDEGCEGKFGWCDIDRPLANWTAWFKNEPSNDQGIENCVALRYRLNLMRSLQESYFVDRNCKDPLFFICEERNPTLHNYKERCKRPKCLAHKCIIDNSTIVNGTRNVPAAVGKLKKLCSKTYLFSKIEVPWVTAQEICCSLNMRLLTITTKEKMECFRDMDTTIGFQKPMSFNPFWTAGSDENCEGKFGWCKTRELVPSWLKWKPGDPNNENNNENCIRFEYSDSMMGQSMKQIFNDRNCQEKNYFICEKIDVAVSNATSLLGKNRTVKANVQKANASSIKLTTVKDVKKKP